MDRHRDEGGARIARRTRPRQSSPTAAAILGQAEAAVNEVRTAGLEEALAAEAKEIAARRGLKLTPPLLRRVPYRGAQLDVRVPHLRVPNGPPEPPPLLVLLKADPHGMITLLRAGVSGAKMEQVLMDLYGERAPGSSSSNVSRLNVEAGVDSYEELMTRRFDDPEDPIVAASLDGTAIGKTGDKQTVMIVIGVTATGRRRALGACIAQHEPKGPILELLTNICERGVHRDIVWTTDRGEGIAKALEALGARHVQLCTTHVARNIAEKLPSELQEEVRLRFYEALAPDDPDLALGRLALLADHLQSHGYLDRAMSLRRAMHRLVTLHRLDLAPGARQVNRSINGQEGANDSLKDALRLVDFWREDRERDDETQPPQVPMRLRWVGKRLLELERDSWNRQAEPQELVKLMERTLPGRYNVAAILAKLPPSLVVTKLRAAQDARSGLPRFAERWCKESPDATWIGSPHALAAVGVDAGGAVDQRALLLTMQGRHAATGETLRKAEQISVVRYGDDGQPHKLSVPGVLCVAWELTASPSLQAAWNEADPDAKPRLEQAFRGAASAAVAEVTSTTQPGHGSASTAALDTSPGRDGTPELRIRGVAVGVVRGKAATKLGTPAAEDAFRAATARDAEDAAKEVLDHALARLPSAEPIQEPPAREPPAAALMRAVEARAIDRAAAIVGGDQRQLAASVADRDEAFDSLELLGGEVRAWAASNGGAAAREIAGARLRAATDGGDVADLCYPLKRGDRLVLGEEAAQRLLGEAAYLLGRADADPRLAGELREAAPGALAGLRPAVERVERAAAAIAARHELRRQELFRKAGEKAAAGRTEITEAATVDRTGRPIKPPLERQSDRLGPRLDPFKRYAAAVAEWLAEERPDDATLQVLATELGEPWRDREQLVPERANQLVAIERKREAVLAEFLRGRRLLGKLALDAERAAASKDGRGFFAATDRTTTGKRITESQWEQLRTIEAELEQRLREPGNLDEFLRRRPEAAVQSAVAAERLSRAQALAQAQQRGAEQAVASGPPSPGDGIGR